MAAGVFGMARKRGFEKVQRPPRHDRYDRGVGANQWREHRHDLGRHLRLDRDHRRGDLADPVAGRIETHAARRQFGQMAGGHRFDDGEIPGRESEGQPAFEQGAPHLAGAGQQNGSGQVGERVGALRRRSRCCHGRVPVSARKRTIQ
jgi:hypothetical protein